MFAVLLGVCLAAGACGGSGDDEGPAPVLTESVGTATAATSPADPAAEVRAAVTAAQKQYFDAYRAAAANPSDGALVDALRAVYTDQSVAGDNVRGRMEWFAERGYVVRQDPGSYYVIEDISIESLPPAGQAVATVCGWDSDPIIDGVNRAPDGKEIFVRNTPGSGRTRTTWVEQLDGSWKISSGVVVDSWEGENRCPPRPVSS
ncbi:hypothetical protein I6A84_28330 [Frankia sp. CNm7]|uniref:Uncharacterized protein n=1 Tax=Frankia nepalensis TaxID=1836974 RepID=A0A937UNF4_9ACTN|nr:hypothetical protein [Frankia nepalensis]MBL7498775.1 hypothetical protein [Frankia nepalensis]MBL7508361.1 hypothetical protein [Frankia nepalensis]MBL7521882.1 hypothetical protein [Frankia nepalensis]MBL7626190.1 hypothetical protein [Frankia nepalensis]